MILGGGGGALATSALYKTEARDANACEPRICAGEPSMARTSHAGEEIADDAVASVRER